MFSEIDVNEQKILEYNSHLLRILLKDHTTGGNIRWATEDYAHQGENYSSDHEIKPELITKKNARLIQPRVLKTKRDKDNRTKEKAEVFTPAWICNEQNNLVDQEWFGIKDVFNKKVETPNNQSWETTTESISFPNTRGKTWQDYVDSRRLEVSCGEAPYLVSRYDSTTGKAIPPRERIGILDRKMRVINENVEGEKEWLKWVVRAYESTYGYDYQGDNVLLARENLLLSFIDYYKEKNKEDPSLNDIKKIATIISWNIWQMNGITMTAPYSKAEKTGQISLSLSSLLPGAVDVEELFVEQAPAEMRCVIMDWRAKEKVEYAKIAKGAKKHGCL